MEQRYQDRMGDIRTGFLKSMPSALLEASKNPNPNDGITTDEEVAMAMEFLDAHARPERKRCQQTLERFVALKEASEALNNNQQQPPDFPQVLLEKLLDEDPELLHEMLLADGPSGGNYGKAMEIYEEIYTASDAVHDSDYPVLHRMAVAIALVHATPVVQTHPLECSSSSSSSNSNSSSNSDPGEFVDPVCRYFNYECAYMDGELDPAFDTLTTWELRFVVDGDEPDEIAAWGRKTLRNFYPDHALDRNNPEWQYSGIVRSDIPYGSSRVKDDDPKLHKYQNILRNGGICGRRAFFGRFILRAFGIPTTARPSKGHAASARWTPTNGGEWVINLGGGWGKGWTKTRYVKDLDFEATARARNSDLDSNSNSNSGDDDDEQYYSKVKMAQFIGDLFDEKKVYGIHSESGKKRGEKLLLDLEQKSQVGLWYRVSLEIQKSILASNRKVHRTKIQGTPVDTIVQRACKQKSTASKCCILGDGTIRIPASSYDNPKKKNRKDVKVMKGIEIPIDDEDNSNNNANANINPTGSNQQIYLPSFQPEGTTVLRGGTWKCSTDTGCSSGTRLLSDGKGKYSDWGFRAALTLDNGEEEEEVATSTATATVCPEPELALVLSGGVTIEFVYIPPGTFVMGGTNDKDGRFKCVEVPHHPVEISKGFYLGKYPVTQEQYSAVVGKNPSKSIIDPKCPVDNVSSEDAVRFCETASEAIGSDIRLPTEAEWEYAARGSTHGTSADPQWFFGDDTSLLGDYAWHEGNSGGNSHPVGSKKANPFGLYDLYGNVWERISDTYLNSYYNEGKNSGVVVDPTGPSQGTKSGLTYELKDIPEAGRYFLTARVCTINVKQHLRVSTNGESDGKNESKNETGVLLNLPFTLGDWKDSDPLPLELKKGDNTLHFWRDAPPQYGISIKEFVLTKAN